MPLNIVSFECLKLIIAWDFFIYLSKIGSKEAESLLVYLGIFNRFCNDLVSMKDIDETGGYHTKFIFTQWEKKHIWAKYKEILLLEINSLKFFCTSIRLFSKHCYYVPLTYKVLMLQR